MTDTTTAQCPNCGSFAWFYDDTALAKNELGEVVDMDVCHCEDCDHMWPVEPVLDDDIYFEVDD